MTVCAYRSQPYETTHENRAFDALLGALETEWGKSEDTVALLGNLYCRGSELDAAIIRQRSITVLDFKDYGGKIHFSENGTWFADDVEVKGGSKRNPYHQIRTNKFAFLEFIQDLGKLPSGRSPNLGHISGMVLFHRPITFDENQVAGPISRWLHVVDMEHATLRISQLTSRKIDLTNDDIEAIVRSTGLSEYRPAGAGVQLETKSSGEEFHPAQELQEELRESWLQLADFLYGQNSVAIVAGMIGTGKRRLLKALVHQAELTGRNLTVLCPNRRLAMRCTVEATSIYGHIYSGNPHLQKGQLVYDRLDNKDDPRHLYVIDDAHLISDSLFETEVLRFGSGQLLMDLIEYMEIGDPGRQIVFLGDPYQLGRGNFDECALSKSRIEALTGHEPIDVELDRILVGNEDDIFTKNCIALANSIRLGRFNELEILTNDESCLEAPAEDHEKKALFEREPSPKFVAFSHSHVNQFNDWVRRTIYGREGRLISGDIVQIHNGFFIHDEQGLEHPYLVQNDCFAEILDVTNEPETLRQELRGREKPVEISFLRVRARFQHDGAVKDFLCLRDYLLSEKPEIDPETLLALRVSAAASFKRKYGEQLDGGFTESEEGELLDGSVGLEADRLAAFMRSDPYLNAARMRIGYGLTLHRAQGQRYPEVVANLDTGQGQTNEAYFRWLYTLFTIPEKKLHLANIPKLSPFVQAKWDETRSQLNKVEPDELIRYDPNTASSEAGTSGFDFPAPELAALHHHVSSLLSEIGFTIVGVEHHQYQETYELQGSEEVKCRLRLLYKKGFKISRISIVDPSVPDVSDRVREALRPDIAFDDEFQKRIHEEVRLRLTSNSIEVRGVEHGSYKEIYFLRCADGEAKVEFNYNKDGFVTVVALSTYSDPRMKQRVRQGLGF